MSRNFNPSQLSQIPDPFVDGGDTLGKRAHAAPSASLPPPRTLAPAPTRAHVRGLRRGAIVAAVVYDALGFVVHPIRPNLASLPATRLLLEIAVPVVAATLSSMALSRKGALGLGETTERLVILVLGAPLAFAVATLALAPPDAADTAFWPHAFRCMMTTALLGIGPLLIGLLAVRRAFATAAAYRTAALGVACGAMAATAISFLCPVDTAHHVLIGHGAMMVVLGAAGALLGRRAATA